jgi:transketolase
MVSDSLVGRLERQAAVIRRHVIEVAAEHVCHIGGALSAADLITALYFHVLKLDPADPRWPERDYFILSKGHSVLALYAALAERGFFPVETLPTFEQKGSKLAAHPTLKAPGVEVATGSLGHGLPIGMGIAIACRAEGSPNRVFVMMGDGEMQEGSVWEAALAAPRFELDHLVAIIDQNRFQASDAVDNIVPVGPLADKWRSFRWDAVEIDGNDMAQVVAALESASGGPKTGRPMAIIAHTVKGKGAPCLENTPRAHFTRLTAEEAAEALRGLEVAP